MVTLISIHLFFDEIFEDFSLVWWWNTSRRKNNSSLTAYIQRFAFFALSDCVVDLAFDDGIMVLPGHVVQHHLRCVVADNGLVVEEPPIGDICGVGVRVTPDSDLGAFRYPSIGRRSRDYVYCYFRRVFDLENKDDVLLFIFLIIR